MSLPDFFVVGAPKAGTTALHVALARHPRLFMPRVKRIVAAVPEARMIALLRDPVDRAHSSWTHLWSAGLEPEGDFLRACDLESRRAARGWAPFWRYLDLGRWGEQLRRLFGLVPREQVLLLLRYRDLRETPVETLDTIFDLLGVETGAVSEIPAENVTTHVTDSTRNRVIGAALRRLAGKIGTGYQSIGDPFGDRATERTRRRT